MTDLTFYKYKVQWYDTENAITNDLCGITVGESYSDAFARVLDYYGGEREVESLYIEAWDISQCLEMRPEVLRCVEFDDSDPKPTPTGIAKSLDVNLDFVIPNNDPIWMAYFLIDSNLATPPHYGNTIDEIKDSPWYCEGVNLYGEDNCIFEQRRCYYEC